MKTEISLPYSFFATKQTNKFEFLHHYGYGAGRRICPGIHLAERTQWRIIAKLLWAFDIKLPIDPVTGKEVAPDPEAYKEGIMNGPLPYEVLFKPRSQAHMDVIMKNCEDSRHVLEQWE